MTDIASPDIARRRLALLAAYVVGGLLAATWGPRLPDLTRELHLSTGGIGAILAAANLGLLAGLSLASRIARWRGARVAVALSLAGVVVALAACAGGILIGSAAGFAVSLLVLGFATGVLDVLVNVEGARVEQTTGRTFLPLLHALWLVGAAIGAALGALCAGLRVGVGLQAAALSLLIAVVGVLIVRAIPRDAVVPRAPEAPGPRSRRRPRRRLHLDARLLALGVLVFGVELAEGSARTWIPLAAEHGTQRSDAVAALFVTVFSITTAGFRAIGGPVVDRLGRVRAVRGTIAIGIVGVVLFIVAAGTPLALIATMLWAVGNCLAGPLAMSAAAEGEGDAVARVALVSTIGFAAGLAGPPLMGLLAQQTSVVSTFWLLAGALGLAFALAGSMRRAPAEAAP